MLLKYKSFTHFGVLCTSHKDLSYFDIHTHFLRIHIIGPFLVRFLRHRRYNEHNRRSGGEIEGQRKKHLVKRSNSGTAAPAGRHPMLGTLRRSYDHRPSTYIHTCICIHSNIFNMYALVLMVVYYRIDDSFPIFRKLNCLRNGEAGNSPALNYASTTESVIFIVRNIAQYLQRLHRQQLSE